MKSRVVEVKGPLGTIKRSFKHAPVDIQKKDGKVSVRMWLAKYKQAASVNTIGSHIRNMVNGVKQVCPSILEAFRDSDIR